MHDREFLIWLHQRLVLAHGEDEIVDYMHKLRCIIADMPKEQLTPNDGRGANSYKGLVARLKSRAADTQPRESLSGWLSSQAVLLEKLSAVAAIEGQSLEAVLRYAILNYCGRHDVFGTCASCGLAIRGGEPTVKDGPHLERSRHVLCVVSDRAKLAEADVARLTALQYAP